MNDHRAVTAPGRRPSTPIRAVLLAALVAGGTLWWWIAHTRKAPPALPPPAETPEPPSGSSKPARTAVPRRADKARNPAELSAAEKEALIEEIKRDYDEIRAKAAAEFSAAGNSFPGGLNAFLRQLALLEREKRKDFASFLSPRELEDLEMRETNAGKAIQKHLGDTAAAEEQRRAAFRLQLEFEDRFALTFDLSPPALLERERARQETQDKIRAALGDALFGSWLRSEGPDFANMSAFAEKQGLPPDAVLNLWKAKSEFTLRRLELAARGLPPAEHRAAQALLVRETEGRVMAVLGAGPMQAAGQEVLGWLPRR